MTLIYSDGMKLFYAHVPKTAGTSVEAYLSKRFGDVSMHGEGAWRFRKRGIVPPPNHLTVEDLHFLLPAKIDYSFATVREPLSRLASEYRYQLGGSRIGRLGFSTWLHLVLACARRDPRMYENHIRPQSDLVPEGSEIFKLEEGLDSLRTRLDEVTGKTADDVTIEHLLKRKSRKVEITRQDAELIKQFYAVDYARFGYDDPTLDPDLPSDRLAFLRSAFAALAAPLLVLKHKFDWLR